MGTNCASLLANLFLYSYEAEFIQNILDDGNKKLAKMFILTFRYIDDELSLNKPIFRESIDLVYPLEPDIKYHRFYKLSFIFRLKTQIGQSG